MFTPIEIELCVGGGVDISYSVRQDGEFFVAGIAGESDMSDTECCEMSGLLLRKSTFG